MRYIGDYIYTIYKRKGDKAICGNSRGISLLSVAGKVLAGVMLRRLLDIVMPESQCGFRRGRSTIDIMFVARLYYRKNAASSTKVSSSLSLT